MARQPEIAGNINAAMILAAALIEGVTFFALIIILLQYLLQVTDGTTGLSAGGPADRGPELRPARIRQLASV